MVLIVEAGICVQKDIDLVWLTKVDVFRKIQANIRCRNKMKKIDTT